MRVSRSIVLVVLTATLVVGTAVASLLVGSGDLDDASLRETFLSLRTARWLAAFAAGASLSVGGVVVQGLFRNPLADPGVIGTTGGAVLGGKITLLALELVLGRGALRHFAPEMLVPVGCMVGALLALVSLSIFLRRTSDLLMLLLLGFTLSALFDAVGSFLTVLAQEEWELGRALVTFSLGTVSGTGLRHVLFAIPAVVAGTLATYAFGPSLDLLLSGEAEATTLGLDVHRTRFWCTVWVAVLTGAAVSVGGFVGFVGLIVPHALRPFTGVGHRRLVPYAAVVGGVFVVACDVLVRALPTPTEMPLGIVTSLVGAPVFLRLLMRARAEAADA